LIVGQAHPYGLDWWEQKLDTLAIEHGPGIRSIHSIHNIMTCTGGPGWRWAARADLR